MDHGHVADIFVRAACHPTCHTYFWQSAPSSSRWDHGQYLRASTVSKIFSEKDENGDPAYKELHIMWEILGSKAQILKYGMTHLQNKQKNKR